jgi:hypothetical protein
MKEGKIGGDCGSMGGRMNEKKKKVEKEFTLDEVKKVILKRGGRIGFEKILLSLLRQKEEEVAEYKKGAENMRTALSDAMDNEEKLEQRISSLEEGIRKHKEKIGTYYGAGYKSLILSPHEIDEELYRLIEKE